MKIIFTISEVEELVKTGGLADVGKALPLALEDAGHDVSIIMPYYQAIRHQFTLATACTQQTLFTQNKVYPFDIRQLKWNDIDVYFVDYPPYFDRGDLYSSTYQAYQDNGERFSFFCGAALMTMQSLALKPDIIHCHDWHTAMLPFLLKHDSSGEFTQTKSVFTIHNAAFQGVHQLDSIPFLQQHPAISAQVHGGYINMLQTGIEYADKITTVSPNYALELLTNLGSHGLHDRLVTRHKDLSGILNGCDYTQWNPATDPHLPKNYSADDISGKQYCKQILQQQTGLPDKPHTPLIGMVCRLTEQKGFGYILPMLDELMEHNVQLVIVGTGDPSVCMDLDEYAHNHPHQFAFINGFSTEHAHWVEAGADFFLMPSQFEPCGLNQMYSLAYGTLPIVRAVGGLKDTVIDPKDDAQNATGFAFSLPSPEGLLTCIRRALLFYYEHPDRFKAMQQRAMHTRFTWQKAASEYSSLYQQMQPDE